VSLSFPSAVVRRGLFHSLRFEVVAILVAGVFVPVALTGLIEGGWQVEAAVAWSSRPAVVNSVIGVVLCALTSLLILRRLRFFPGVAVARSILPVVAIVFGVFIAVIAGLRLEYSNRVIGACITAILATRFAITAVRSRAKGLLYYLVPEGRAKLIKDLRGATVLLLSDPTLKGLPDCAIVADLTADLNPDWERFLAEAAISGRPVYHFKQVWEAETGKVQIEHLSENGFGALVPSIAYQKVKRVVDLMISMACLPVIVPLLAMCAVAIIWDTDGPVIFRQRRMGFRGNVFHVLKLRTMIDRHDGESRDISITQSDDDRITKVGRFLRRTRLDELPQVFNILRGEMSWIGPRPEAVSLSSWYENEIPFYRYRHIVRPGITGWAQVNQGHVADVEQVTEKLQYDFYYIKNLSYWLDIIIVLRTVKVVLSGFGSK
jgi:lipopolysaccharide/colanic/teichoic acid biosynthesis glycosyltransferase